MWCDLRGQGHRRASTAGDEQHWKRRTVREETVNQWSSSNAPESKIEGAWRSTFLASPTTVWLGRCGVACTVQGIGGPLRPTMSSTGSAAQSGGKSSIGGAGNHQAGAIEGTPRWALPGLDNVCVAGEMR